MHRLFNKGMLVGIVLVVLGVIAIVYAVHSANEVSEVKGWTHQATNFFQSTWGKIVGKEMEKQAGKYDTKITVLLISGIIVTLGGAWIMYKEVKRIG